MRTTLAHEAQHRVDAGRLRAVNAAGEGTDLTSSSTTRQGASATLTVDDARPGFLKSFSPDSITAGATSSLTLTIDNTLNVNPLFGLNFVDPLPSGMTSSRLSTPGRAKCRP